LEIGIVMLCISLTTARFVSKLPETKGVAMGVAAITHPDMPIEHSETELSASREIL
jgi:hypothetical protein